MKESTPRMNDTPRPVWHDSSQTTGRSLISYPIQGLDWDTRYFGQKMGSIDFTRIPASDYAEAVWRTTLADASRQGFQFLFCQVDATAQSFANWMMRSGARLGDTLITFQRDLAPLPEAANDITVDDARESDLAALYEIAGASFRYSRFVQDPRFDREKARQLYRNWLAESYQTERILVARTAAAISGFVSFSLDQKLQNAVIRLLATSAAARGQGVGKRLIARLLDLAAQAGVERVQVGTQINNYGAVRFYERTGFRCHDVKYRFHCWLDECAEQVVTATD